MSIIKVRILLLASMAPNIFQAEFKAFEYLIHRKTKHLSESQYSLNKIKMQEPKMEKRILFLIGKSGV